MSEIKEVLMRRDGMPDKEASLLIKEAKEQLQNYLAEGYFCAAENICEEFFGLEPDYIYELL